MSDRETPLIERAAAALRKNHAAKVERILPVPAQVTEIDKAPLSTIQRVADIARTKPFDEPERQPRTKERSSRGADQSSRPSMGIVSPTSLASNAIVLPSAGNSRTVEEFRSIKREIISNITRVADKPGRSKQRAVLVTSANPAEGKTFTAINLALALAYEKDTSVLLVDADAYRQSAVGYLGVSSEYGWLDIVSGRPLAARDVVIPTNLPGLSVLPAGRQRSEIPELMSSRRMAELFEELTREDFASYVVIDSAPCLSSNEPSILAGLAGQTVFVVAAQKTSHDDIDASLRLLNSSPCVSLVLNKVHPQLTDQFRKYGYGYDLPR